MKIYLKKTDWRAGKKVDIFDMWKEMEGELISLDWACGQGAKPCSNVRVDALPRPQGIAPVSETKMFRLF